MAIIEINNIKDSRVNVYSSLTERQLKVSNNGEGIFIAESPKVIEIALASDYEPLSILCERRHIDGDAAKIIAANPSVPVYTGEREILADLTGYRLTRGVLCAMKRKAQIDVETVCRDAHRIAVIEAVCDTTNIGSIFRSATALGVDGILLTLDSCDPLNRRSIRVSMGTVFKIPWCFSADPVTSLKSLGFTTVALTLERDSISIDSRQLNCRDKLAMVLGTEGDGLSRSIISKCDYKAIIPMQRGVDSLNVGAAAALAFWELRREH